MKTIFLHLRSSLIRYKLVLYDKGSCITKTVSGGQECISLCTNSNVLWLDAFPLDAGFYMQRICLNVQCGNVFNVSLNFLRQPVTRAQSTSPLTTFTLTDANYGMPLSGTLSLSQI